MTRNQLSLGVMGALAVASLGACDRPAPSPAATSSAQAATAASSGSPSNAPPSDAVPVTSAAAPGAPRSIVELALSKDPADWQKTRTILESRVYSHRGSLNEVRLLRSVCKQQGDDACLKRLDALQPR